MPINPASPLARLLAFIVGVVVLTAAVIVGSFVLSAILGIALIAGVVVYAQLWWMRRKVRKTMEGGESQATGAGRVIETEYTVIEVSDKKPRSTNSDDGAHQP